MFRYTKLARFKISRAQFAASRNYCDAGFIKPIFIIILLGLAAAYWVFTSYSTSDSKSYSFALEVNPENSTLHSLKQELDKAMGGSSENLDWSIIYRGNEVQRAQVAAAIAEASNLYGINADLLRAVIMTESLFNSTAVSKKGAQGLMQIMPKTAKHLSLEDPLDPRENILAGAAYLSQLLKKFDGDIRLSVAAYNLGPAALKESNGELPKEIVPYVSKVLSYYELFSGSRIS